MTSGANLRFSGQALALNVLGRHVLASPVPEISPSVADSLPFAELAQKAFSRILELGFLRGVALSLS